MTARSHSIVEYYAYQTQRQCGYCNRPNTNCSHGMWAHFLSVQDYQDLIDRGWRRSGQYCYKPTMDQTCCPMYTIRCDALDFKITKSQKKILKRMAKFLRNDSKEDHKLNDSKRDTPDNIDVNTIEVENYAELCSRAKENVLEMKVDCVEGNVDNRLQMSCEAEGSSQTQLSKRENVPDATPSLKNTGNKSGPPSKEESVVQRTIQDPNRPPPKKAKLIRVERKQKKLLAQGKSPEEIETLLRGNRQNQGRNMEELFIEIHGGDKKFETVLVQVWSDEFFESLDVSANLYKKYQMAIHEQTADECDKESFLNFLVKSPLEPYSSPRYGPPQRYGSFHEQYWLNGELIAVGVIDILPSCVSSVYFFYDPDYSFLSLGTFSSLREVCLTRQLNKVAPSIKYYYMGFYIHSNAKMRYKAKIKPSKLLCPETYVWCDFDRSITKIDKQKYSRLNDDMDAIDENGTVDLQKVMVLHRQTAMPYGSYTKRTAEDDELVREYVTLVGMKCAQSLLLYRK